VLHEREDAFSERNGQVLRGGHAKDMVQVPFRFGRLRASDLCQIHIADDPTVFPDRFGRSRLRRRAPRIPASSSVPPSSRCDEGVCVRAGSDKQTRFHLCALSETQHPVRPSCAWSSWLPVSSSPAVCRRRTARSQTRRRPGRPPSVAHIRAQSDAVSDEQWNALSPG